MNKVYLNVEFSSGRAFEYSKEEKEGYEKHTSSKGNVSFRKYYKGVTGVLESVSIRDTNFGQQVSLTLNDGDTVQYLPFSIYSPSGNVDNSFMESLITLLPNMNKGTRYTITPYNFTPENEQYAKTGVSVKDEVGGKVEKALSFSYYKDGKLVPGDIPAIEWVKKLGKNRPSAVSLEKKDSFLLEILEREVARLKWVGENAPTASTPPPAGVQKKVKAETAVVNTSNEVDDELPF